MAPEPAPAGPAGASFALLEGLQSAVGELQRAAIDSEQQLAGAREAAAAAEAEVRRPVAWATHSHCPARPAHLCACSPVHKCARRPAPHVQAVLVGAYGRRLERLAALLQQYDAQLYRALAAVGLAQQQQQGEQLGSEQQGGDQQGHPRPATADALAALAGGLRRLEQQLVTAALEAAEPPAPEALLQLGGDAALARQAATAGPAAILQALQGEGPDSRLAHGPMLGCLLSFPRLPALASLSQSPPLPPLLLQLRWRETSGPSMSGPRWLPRLRRMRRPPRWTLPSPGYTWSKRKGGWRRQRGSSA